MIRYTNRMDSNIDNSKKNDANASDTSTEESTPPPSLKLDTPVQIPIKEIEGGKSKYVAIILAIIFALTAMGAVAYFILNKPAEDTDSNMSTVSTKPTAKKAVGAQGIVDEVSSVLKATPVKAVVTDGGSGEAPDGTVVYSYPTYQLANYNFIAGPDKGYGTAVSNVADKKADIDKDYAAMVTILEDKDFKSEQAVSTGSESTGKRAIYATDSVVCGISTMYNVSEKNYASISCADMSTYIEAAKTIDPFYKAYAMAFPEAVKPVEGVPPLSFSLPKVSDGAEGYKNAEVSITKVNPMKVLFYWEPGSTWKYAMSVQTTTPLCTAFTTPALKKAFSGKPCTDSRGAAMTVKV